MPFLWNRNQLPGNEGEALKSHRMCESFMSEPLCSVHMATHLPQNTGFARRNLLQEVFSSHPCKAMAILPLLAATRLHLIIHNALLLIVTKMLPVEIIRNKRKQHEKKNRQKFSTSNHWLRLQNLSIFNRILEKSNNPKKGILFPRIALCMSKTFYLFLHSCQRK